MTKSRPVALGLAALFLTAACSGTTDQNRPDQTGNGPGLTKVVFAGDSIAVGEALPLAVAMKASGVEFQSIAAEGGGNVVGPFAVDNWPKLAERIISARASAVVYQLTTYDWGTEDEQRAGYEKLRQTVTETGADLLFVTAPPIRPDDFYQPHLADLARSSTVARSIAEAAPDHVGLLDATAVWGEDYQQTKDGTADRSADGIHTCPQGAARFTRWLLGKLGERFPGFTPADPKSWANAGWSADKHFQGC
jgi:hypothetical protein